MSWQELDFGFDFREDQWSFKAYQFCGPQQSQSDFDFRLEFVNQSSGQSVDLTPSLFGYVKKNVYRKLSVGRENNSLIGALMTKMPEQRTGFGLTGSEFYKDKYKKFIQYYGMAPKSFLKIFAGHKAAIINLLFKNVLPESLVKKLCVDVRKGVFRINREKYIMLQRSCGNVSQALLDSNGNIIPFILYFQKDPKALKEFFGKGLWKRLCRNSYSRNFCISQSCQLLLQKQYSDKKIKHVVQRMNDSPLYLIKVFKERSFHPLVPKMTKSRQDSRVITRVNNILSDNERMMNQVGFFRDMRKMSHDEVLALHRDLQQAIREKRYTKEPYGWMKGCGDVDYNGAKAILRRSPYDVYKEGEEMSHCVAGYADRCMRGDYMVWHLVEGKDKSTLGIFKDTKGTWCIQQHYGFGNSFVENQKLLTLANKVLKHMNETQHEDLDNAQVA